MDEMQRSASGHYYTQREVRMAEVEAHRVNRGIKGCEVCGTPAGRQCVPWCETMAHEDV